MDPSTTLPTVVAGRRTVVAAGMATAAALAAPDVAHAAPSAPERERFEKLVGETFEATLEGRTVRLRLDGVTDADVRPPKLRGARLARWRASSYVLTFSTRATVRQGTWTLRSRRSRRFPLFVVPGATDRRGRALVTATFNGWRG